MTTKIPRYIDDNGIPYEMTLKCTKCEWRVVKDRWTIRLKFCPLCDSELKTERIDYAYLR